MVDVPRPPLLYGFLFVSLKLNLMCAAAVHHILKFLHVSVTGFISLATHSHIVVNAPCDHHTYANSGLTKPRHNVDETMRGYVAFLASIVYLLLLYIIQPL